jgi:hypothetical protein
MNGLNLEIWFPQQDLATVFLESSLTDPEQEQFSETSLFALFAARQIANLRSGNGLSLSLVLGSVDPERALAGVKDQLDDVRVEAPSSRGGRKGFTAELRPDARGFFKALPHGFGLMGRGLDYCGPTSTLALLYWLLKQRADDPAYQIALGAIANIIGAAGASGAITMTSQTQVAMTAVGAGWTDTDTIVTDFSCHQRRSRRRTRRRGCSRRRTR